MIYSNSMKSLHVLSQNIVTNIPPATSNIYNLNNTNFQTLNSLNYKYSSSKNDLLPILTTDKNDVFGFLYLRDYLYFISNCESNQNLTNEKFLINMYEGIDDNKPYGKERIIYLEYNEESKKYKIKELLEKINAAPEKKIVFREDPPNKVKEIDPQKAISVGEIFIKYCVILVAALFAVLLVVDALFHIMNIQILFYLFF